MWSLLRNRFLQGAVLGLILSTGSWLVFRRHDTNWQTIAQQNANAAADTTRLLLQTRDSVKVYGRLLAQKDVELTGALATAERLRGSHSVVAGGVTAKPRGIDTTATHPNVQVGTEGPSVPGLAGTGSRFRDDSLVLNGPPVEGKVRVLVSDSTIVWSAKLKPSPIPLSLSVGCSKSGPELSASGPSWVEIQIQSGQVEPRVCNPPKLHRSVVEKALTVTGAVVVVVKAVNIVKSIVH